MPSSETSSFGVKAAALLGVPVEWAETHIERAQLLEGEVLSYELHLDYPITCIRCSFEA